MTKRGMAVKRTNCAEARVDHMLGDMNNTCFAINSIETLTLACAWVIMDVVSPTQSLLQYASADVINWSLLNETDYKKGACLLRLPRIRYVLVVVMAETLSVLCWASWLGA
jgi:hypothetical protein